MRSWTATALSVVILMAACGGEQAEEALDTDTLGTSAAPDTQPAPAATTADGVLAVDVVLDEWRVTLSRDTVQAGPVSFRVRNEGEVTHRFEVEGNGEEVVTDDLAPGDEITMSLNLTAGTYEVYCPIEAGGQSHADLGMRTRLHVR